MFSGIRKLLGAVSVEERNGMVFVEGIDADVMARDIKSIWGTNKLNANMFVTLDSNSFSIPSFFLPDILYTLEQLTKSRTLKMSIRSLSKIKTLLLENTWLKNTLQEPVSQLDYDALNDFYYPPLSTQVDFFKAYDKGVQQYGLRGMLLAAAAGSGKSLASLFLAQLVGAEKVIIICPKNALNRVWEDTIASAYKKKQSYWISNSGKPYTGKEKFIIVNYDSMSQATSIATSFTTEKVMVILDESHNFNSLTSQRTNVFIEICRDTNASDVVLLSGTPIKALATEAIPLFRCIDPLFTEDVEKRFKRIYGGNNERAVEILKNRMGLVSFKVEKKELNLLPLIFQDIKVTLPNAKDYLLTTIKDVMRKFIEERHEYYRERKSADEKVFEQCLNLYKASLHSHAQKQQYEYYQKCLAIVIRSKGDWAAKDEMLYCNKFENSNIIPMLPKELKVAFKDVKSIIKYVHLKIQGECLGRIVGGLRTKCHVDMVKHIEFKAVCDSTVKKTIVFTTFVDVIRECEKVLPTLGLKPLFVYGKTNTNLNSIVSAFEKDEDANPLVATYASLSTAVPLIMADAMILIDSPFRDYILTQAVSRIHRLGATTQCYAYKVVLDTGDEPNISSRSVDILAWSQSQIEQILGITSPYEIKDDLDSFSAALEGLDEPVQSVVNLQPSFLNW